MMSSPMLPRLLPRLRGDDRPTNSSSKAWAGAADGPTPGDRRATKLPPPSIRRRALPLRVSGDVLPPPSSSPPPPARRRTSLSASAAGLLAIWPREPWPFQPAQEASRGPRSCERSGATRFGGRLPPCRVVGLIDPLPTPPSKRLPPTPRVRELCRLPWLGPPVVALLPPKLPSTLLLLLLLLLVLWRRPWMLLKCSSTAAAIINGECGDCLPTEVAVLMVRSRFDAAMSPRD
mmetsp:Transcript_4310/g.12580  ORF Transcript_4310/g.12580 Transcript_4310/m.12580 type:complete len:233 (+) Transcript_4310:502-1200(+)